MTGTIGKTWNKQSIFNGHIVFVCSLMMSLLVRGLLLTRMVLCGQRRYSKNVMIVICTSNSNTNDNNTNTDNTNDNNNNTISNNNGNNNTDEHDTIQSTTEQRDHDNKQQKQ